MSFDDLRSDVSFFFKNARRHPAFTLTVVGILATGLAASVVVFSLVEALVLDPFPFPDSERLILVGSEMPTVGRPLGFFERLSGPEIVDVTGRTHLFAATFAFDLNSVSVRGEPHPRRLFAGFSWTDPFATLGIEPFLGRGWTDDEVARGEPVTLISHGLWQSLFGGAPDVLGKTVIADGTPYTVVGVLPPYSSIYGVDLWIPMAKPAAQLPRQERSFNLLARLRPEVDPASVDAELATLARVIEEEHVGEFDEYRQWRLAAITWNRFNAFAYEDEAVLALGTVLFVLLLISANLANLLLIRASSRRGEIAVRLVLGASRARVVRQGLVESGLYALLGGALGWILAAISLDAILAWLPDALQPFGKPVTLDGRVVLFAAALTAVSALIFGGALGLQLRRASLSRALAATGRDGSTGRGTRRAHRVLVVVQVALAVVLLSGAGALGTALFGLLRQDLGFDTSGLLSMRLTLPSTRYQGAAVPRFFAHLTKEVDALPGMGPVSIATQVAPSTFFGAELQLKEMAEDSSSARPRPFHTVIGDDYFAVMGIDVLRGRVLDGRDRPDGPCAMVINELAAKRYFSGREALGQQARVKASRFDSGWCEIVGIVATVRQQGLSGPAEPEVFTGHRQAGGRYNQMFLVARPTGDPLSVVGSIRTAVQGLDADQPVYSVQTAAQALAAQTAPRRVTATLVIAFAVVALFLAALGIYGVVAWSVGQRRAELCLRLALGALGRDVARLVIGESMGVVALGLLVGIAAAWGLRQALSSILADLTAPGLVSLTIGLVVLVLAALCASAVPAQRASRLAPAEVLREL